MVVLFFAFIIRPSATQNTFIIRPSATNSGRLTDLMMTYADRPADQPTDYIEKIRRQRQRDDNNNNIIKRLTATENNIH